MSKIYENLALTQDEVLEMQHWLYPQLASKNKKSISDLILSINKKYSNDCEKQLRDYAIYMLGYHIGAARVYEKKGETYVVDQNAL